jgi:hypothetical protein
MSVRVSGTHFEGPILGSDRSGGGLWDDLPIICSNVASAHVLINDFQTQFDEDDMVFTQLTGSGTGDIIADAPGGQYQIASETINQGCGSLQFTGAETAAEGLGVPTAGRIIAFEARVKFSDVDNADWFVGLGETDTTFIEAAGTLAANGADNHIGFHHLLADAGIPDLSYAGTAVANIADATRVGKITAALSDATWYRFGVRLEGTTRMQWFLDGKACSPVTISGTAFADGLVPTFGFISNGSAVTMNIDYFVMAATRLAADAGA